jgi:hypothetical protein
MTGTEGVGRLVEQNGSARARRVDVADREQQ